MRIDSVIVIIPKRMRGKSHYMTTYMADSISVSIIFGSPSCFLASSCILIWQMLLCNFPSQRSFFFAMNEELQTRKEKKNKMCLGQRASCITKLHWGVHSHVPILLAQVVRQDGGKEIGCRSQCHVLQSPWLVDVALPAQIVLAISLADGADGQHLESWC